jgi:hypothetical protein
MGNELSSYHIHIPFTMLTKIHPKYSLQPLSLDFLGVTENPAFINDPPTDLFLDDFLYR